MRISLDNGLTFKTAQEAMPEIEERNLWDTVVQMMDDATREQVHAELSPCSPEEFLDRYLDIAPNSLVLG